MNRNIIVILITLLLTCGLSWAQDLPKAELKVEIVINSDHGWPTKIIVSGTVNQPVAWLGLSLYPYGIIDAITGGRHSFIELKKGEFRQEILVDTKLLGGSFEFGVWGKQTSKVDCTVDSCYWCKINGFHLEQSLAYKSGLLTRQTGYK